MLNRLAYLESQPGFAKQDYSTQIQLRLLALREDLPEAPGFSESHPVVQNELIKKLVFRPPVFEETHGLGPVFTQAAQDYQKRIEQQDPAVKRQMASTTAWSVFAGNAVNRFVWKFLVDPINDLWDKTPGGSHYQMHYGPDQVKFQTWMSTVVDQDIQASKMARNRKLLAGLAGYGEDALAAYIAFGGGAASKALDATYNWIAQNSLGFAQTRLGQTLWKHGMGLAMRAFAEGGKDTLRMLVIDRLSASAGVEPFQRNMWDVAKVWGLGAARDLAWGIVGKAIIAPLATGAWRSIKGFEDYRKAVKSIGEGEFDEALKLEASGRNIPDRVLKTAPDHVQDRIAGVRASYDLVNHPEAYPVGSFNRAKIVAQNMGHNIGKNADGTYRIRSWADPAEVKTLKSLEDLNEELSAVAVKRIKEIPPELRGAMFSDLDSYLMNYGPYQKYWNRIFKGPNIQGRAPLTERDFGSINELNNATKRTQLMGYQGGAVKIRLPVDELENIAQGKAKLPDHLEVQVTPEGANGFAYIRKAASFDDYQRAAQIAKRFGSETPENVLKAHGFDAAAIDETGEVLKVLNKNNVKVFSEQLSQGALRTSPQIAKAAKSTNLGTFIRGYMKVAGNLNELSKSSDNLSRVLASGIQRGSVDLQKVKAFSLMYLNRYGVKPSMIEGKLDFEYGPTMAAVRAQVQGGKALVHIPAKLASGESERLFVRSLVDQLEELVHPGEKAARVGERAAVHQLFEKVRKGIPQGRMMGLGSTQREAARLAMVGDEPGETFLKRYENVLRQDSNWTTRLGGEQALKHIQEKITRDLKVGFSVSSSGEVNVTAANGLTTMSYKNMDEALDALLPKTLTKSDAKVLAAEQGLRLIENKDGSFTLFDPTRRLQQVTGNTIEEVIFKAGLPVKPPSRYMPSSVLVSGDQEVQMSFARDMLVTGDINKAQKMLSEYLGGPKTWEGTRRIAARIPGWNGELYQTGQRYFVHDPSIDHWFDAESVDEVKRLMTTGVRDPEILKQVALEKHLGLVPDAHGWTIKQGNSLFSFTNEEELKAFLRQHPLPQDGPELVDLDGEVQAMLNKSELQARKGDFQPVDFGNVKHPGELGMGLRVSYGLQMKDYWIPQAASNAGHPQIAFMFRKLDRAHRLAGKAYMDAMLLVDRALSVPLPNGKFKLLSDDRLDALWHYMGASPDKLDDVAKLFKITDAEKEMAGRIRVIMGQDPMCGAAAKFLDDPNDFLPNYMHRMVQNLKRMDPQEIARLQYKQMDLAKKLLGRERLPADIYFSAQQQRLLEDLGEFDYNTNLRSVLDAYFRRGYLQFYLNADWKNMVKYMNANWGTIPEELKSNVNLYMKQLLDQNPSKTWKILQNQGADVLSSLGLNRATDGPVKANVLQMLYGMQYMTTMAWRPFLPFRNLLQVYSTLAPRFGNSGVNEVLREIATGDMGQGTYTKLQALGEINDDLPIFGEIPGSNSWLNKQVKRGMTMFKNSDDWTRVVAFRTAERQFQDAMQAYQRGLINGEQFMVRSGVNLVDADVQETVKTYMRANQWEQASDTFGLQVVRETMFSYATKNKPAWYTTSVLGKLFGMYGVYSSGYLANIIRGFRYGTPTQKLAFAGRLLANNAAIYGAFKAMGVNAKGFLPWAPLQFTGGPLFWLSMSGIKALGPGYEGRAARAELAKLVPANMVDAIFKGESIDWSQLGMFTPGYYQARSIQNFVEKVKAGQYMQAFWALSTAPLSPEALPVPEDVIQYLSGPVSGVGTGMISQSLANSPLSALFRSGSAGGAPQGGP